MKPLFKPTAIAMACTGLAGAAFAADVPVNANITTDTLWTKNNVYDLQAIVFVKNGATLTIEAGTQIRSSLGGTLVVTRDGKINAAGTAAEPIVFTSKLDTGAWHEGAEEWGNLTICGNAYVSEDVSAIPTNVPFPSAGNYGEMEGLVASLDTRYGGGNDADDSGTLTFCSFRYGGDNSLGLGIELNGLSLGGIGRGTDIHHIDIMNNIDDGIEIWGGTVNLRHLNIWNIGDDSIDIDQGWRGKAQFGLIVQGYSVLSGSQGGGVGDNTIEMDGAEGCTYQPVTSAVLYNMTVVGQPISGDHGATFRENARVQIRNSVFMDLGDELVRFDNEDGDPPLACGYGVGGTTPWLLAGAANDVWDLPFSSYSAINPPVLPETFATMYQSQVNGNLCEITDSVFARNFSGAAYTQSNSVGVTSGGGSTGTNVVITSALDSDLPIQLLKRAAPTGGSLSQVRVLCIDPRPDNAAETSVGSAPADGFLVTANYRGAFAPSVTPWVKGWTAADQYGFLATASATVQNDPLNVPSSLVPVGVPSVGNLSFGFTVQNPTSACGVVGANWIGIVGISIQPNINLALPGYGCTGGLGTVIINPTLVVDPLVAPVGGFAALPIPDQDPLCGAVAHAQVLFLDTLTGTLRAGSAVNMVVGIAQ